MRNGRALWAFEIIWEALGGGGQEERLPRHWTGRPASSPGNSSHTRRNPFAMPSSVSGEAESTCPQRFGQTVTA